MITVVQVLGAFLPTDCSGNPCHRSMGRVRFHSTAARDESCLIKYEQVKWSDNQAQSVLANHARLKVETSQKEINRPERGLYICIDDVC